ARAAGGSAGGACTRARSGPPAGGAVGAVGGAGCPAPGACAGRSDRAAGCVMAAFPLPTTRLAALCGAGAALLLAGALARPLVRGALVWDRALALAPRVGLAARPRGPGA